MKNRYKPALLIKLSSPDSLELSSSSVVPRSADSAPDLKIHVKLLALRECLLE